MSWRLTRDRSKDDNDRYRRVDPALSPLGGDHMSYVATDEIIEAVNTAISLGKPLLVAGEPGVGKTRLAHYVASRFGLFEDDARTKPEVFRADVKSTATGSDLIYRYDAIRHFREASIAERRGDIQASRFIDLQPLGQGIALASSLDDLPANIGMRDLLQEFLGPDHQPRMSVVLIDEIDKAPRDVPNDLLREFDEMTLRIPDLGANAILESRNGVRPFVLVTTNDERALPTAFLRRCCFLHIDFPEDPDDLRRIVLAQLGEEWGKAGVTDAVIRLVKALRSGDRTTLKKPPGTAEMLDYLRELQVRDPNPNKPLPERAEAEAVARSVFGNDKGDKGRIKAAFTALRKDG